MKRFLQTPRSILSVIIGLRKSLLITACCWLSNLCFAQTGFRITGYVENPNHEKLMGNAMALSVQDSAFLIGSGFLEGNFELTGLPATDVLLKLTSVQFGDTVMLVRFQGEQQIDLGTITIRHLINTLHEVEVVASRPQVAFRPDGVLEVQVSNTILAGSSTVPELLSRTPNVVQDDDGISVVGKGQAILYLNGKRITTERLSSISVSQVKKIEVMENPTAQYDAEGRAVINIITTGNPDDGYRTTATQSITWSKLAGLMTQTVLHADYRKQRLNIAGNYDLRTGRDRDLFHTTRIRPEQADYLNSALYTDRKRDLKNISGYQLGMSYNLTDKSYFSAEYNGFTERIDDSTNGTNRIVTPSENGLYATAVNRQGKVRNNSLVLNFNRELDSIGSFVFAGGQFSRYRSYAGDHIQEHNIINGEEVSRQLQSILTSEISVYSPQVDVVKVFPSGHSLDMGIKLSYARTSSDLGFFVYTGESVFEKDTDRSTRFSYTETVPAAYVNAKGKLSATLTYTAGLRSEWTNYTLATTALKDGYIQNRYVNFFPNVQMVVSLPKEVKLRLLYTARIARPAYQALNPFLIYQDAFTSVEGNPAMKPEKTHSFEIGASLNTFDMKAGYTYTFDPLNAAALRGQTEKSYVLKGINLHRGHLYYAALSASFHAGGFSSTNTVNISFTELTDNQYGFEQRPSRPQLYIYSSNKATVGKLFTLQMLAWYQGEKYSALYYSKSRALVTLGIERELFRKSLKGSFTVNDVFQTNKPEGNYAIGQTDITYERLYNTRYYRLMLAYTLGRLRQTAYKTKTTGDAENSRAR
jgi:hypothetical protein